MSDAAVTTNDVLVKPESNVATVPAPGPGGANAQASATAAVDDAMKVFAGNLAFATTEDELKSIFSEAGAVSQVQIIKRGTRSLGYGFVTYATESEAQKAVSLLNKREIAGREINVEGAKPQTEIQAAAGTSSSRGAKKTRGRGRGQSGAASSRRPRNDEGEEELEDPVTSKAEAGAVNGDGKPSRARRARNNKKEGTNGAAAAPAATEEGAAATEKPARQPRKPKGAPQGEPSKTLLFVSNLSFAVDDEALKAAFDGFQVASAKVVKRRFGGPGGKLGRSKGFGFVDFVTEAEQQRALKEAHNKTVDGREMSLKVAIQGDDKKDEVEAKAEAAADADPAPAA